MTYAATACRGWTERSRQLLVGLCFGVLTLIGMPVSAADDPVERVWIADPYLELRTAPGQAYPVFYIAERGESVEILKRYTDWFKVRTARGKEGWVSREQMESTLTEAGVKQTFRDVLIEDYLRRRVEAGFSFGSLEGDGIITARIGYRLHDNLLAEFAIGQATGDFSSTTLIYGSLVSQPFPEARWSPFFALGLGRFSNEPKATLVSAIATEADMGSAGLGVRYYLTRRFIVRFEFRDHIALIDHNRTNSYKEVSAGVSFFF